MIAALAIVPTAPAVPAEGQGRPAPAPRAGPPTALAGGWLGIAFQEVPGEGGERLLEIVRVFPESPAAEAGLRRGDTLVELAGRPASPRTLATVMAGLRAGDEVELRIRRDGRLLTRRTRLAVRPGFAAPFHPSMAVRIDSIASAVVQSLDSARGGNLLRRVAPPEHGISPGQGIPLEKGIRMRGVEVGDPVSFSVFMVESERTDRLREQIDELAARIESLSRRRAALEENGSATRTDRRSAVEQLRREEESLRSAVEELRARLHQVAAQELREHRFRPLPSHPAPPEARASARIRIGRPDAPPRPIAPQIVGRHLLAGAEMLTLNADLAGYFGAAEGVLVARVPEGTPAAEAGLAAGDVIVRVGRTRVGSFEELRRLLSDRDRSELTVVRRSEEVRVRLRR